MTKYVKIPLADFEALGNAWNRIANQVLAVYDDPETVESSDTPQAPYNVIWVDPQSGHDSNDALSAGTAVKSWARVFQLLFPGAKVILRPGIYRQPIALANLRSSQDKPIYFKAEVPGTAIFDNYLPISGDGWELQGSNVYKRRNVVKDDGPWCGFAKERFLPRYNCLYDLLGSKLSGVIRKPKYGFAQEDNTLYVRLPGNGDPRKEPTYLTADSGIDFIKLSGSSYVIFEGIKFRGHGNGHAIVCDPDCHHIWVQNCISEHGRQGFNVGKEGTLLNCYFLQPGLQQFATEFYQINQGDKTAFETFAEKYHEGVYDEFTDETYRKECDIPVEELEFSNQTPYFWKM